MFGELLQGISLGKMILIVNILLTEKKGWPKFSGSQFSNSTHEIGPKYECIPSFGVLG